MGFLKWGNLFFFFAKGHLCGHNIIYGVIQDHKLSATGLLNFESHLWLDLSGLDQMTWPTDETFPTHDRTHSRRQLI